MERTLSRVEAAACLPSRRKCAIVDRLFSMYASTSRTAGADLPRRTAVISSRSPHRVPKRKSVVPESLFQRVAAKDPAAVSECIDRFGGLVWSLARRFSASDADAEDAVQEIFVNLWRSAVRFDAAVASEATFVAMIARRRLIDRNRARTRQVAAESIADAPQPAPAPATLESSEDVAVAARALSALSTEQQRVLRLSVYRGLSHEQISQATGLPLGTVKTHIRRGLIKVRELIDHTSLRSRAEIVV